MRSTQTDEPLMRLTATEVSNIWSSYLKSSMELRLFQYFVESIEDQEMKRIIEKMTKQAEESLVKIKEIFVKEQLSVPVGFTEKDVRPKAHKAFSDPFIISFCYDLTLLSMSTYPSAVSDCSRKDIRAYFTEAIKFSMTIQDEIISLLIKKGLYNSPPKITIENQVEMVDSKKYLNGFFGASRPVNTAEIANLTRIIHRAQFSKMVFVAFNKMATTKELAHHFKKGRDGIDKVMESVQEVLEKENIPVSATADYQIYDVALPPFSNKLMLFFVNTCLGIFCFTMINQAMTSSLRSDIVYKLTKISNDMKKFYGLGIVFAINENWMEQPPQGVDHRM